MNNESMARPVGWIVALVAILCSLTVATAAREQNTEPPYRVEVVATGLKFPWSLAFLPNGDALVTEKFGELRVLRKDVLDPAPVTGGPQNILQEGDSGLLDVVLDPAFETNQTVFITFNEGTKEQNHLAVFRAKFDGATLSGGKVIFRNSPEKAGPRSNSTNSAVSDWRPLLLAPWSLTTSPRFRFCNFLRSLCLTNGMEPCGPSNLDREAE